MSFGLLRRPQLLDNAFGSVGPPYYRRSSSKSRCVNLMKSHSFKKLRFFQSCDFIKLKQLLLLELMLLIKTNTTRISTIIPMEATLPSP